MKLQNFQEFCPSTCTKRKSNLGASNETLGRNCYTSRASSFQLAASGPDKYMTKYVNLARNVAAIIDSEKLLSSSGYTSTLWVTPGLVIKLFVTSSCIVGHISDMERVFISRQDPLSSGITFGIGLASPSKKNFQLVLSD
ncbi:hypothetical protein CHS0354_030882 [Potamilus streckersoni]|uniref:Uncharacterized protein n=1 Tax=Potamilus streckersoni TaxID=2493646 RepID=A0AAE0W0R4_9BIVA|nr:hypothetical protein CHS0354_030882 [Potamilus streckersoni]